MKIFIVADDLTGALDTAAQFAARGISTEILRFPVTSDLAQCRSSVVVLDAQSRHLPASDAYQRIYQILKGVFELGVPLIFKKTDSALRGNVGAELAAMSDACGGEQVLFFPAYPQLGRTTIKGVQYIHGVPLNQSAFAQDKLDPVKYSDVCQILRQETDLSCGVIGVEDQEAPESAKVLVFDSETEEQMQRQVDRFVNPDRPGSCLVAGCAGLAKMLAPKIPCDRGQESIRFGEKLFVLSGTNHLVSRRQIQYAVQNGFRQVGFSIGELTDPAREEAFREKIQTVRSLCESRENIVVDILQEPAQQREHDPEDLSRRIVKGLSTVLIRCRDVLHGHTLFLIGGDTLGSYMENCGCQKISVLDEILPGTPISAFSFDGEQQYVISKSGGYGENDVLLQCLNTLSDRKRWTNS